MSPTDRQRGMMCIALAALLWSIAALAIKYLSNFMDLYTQNFVRFLSASVFLWVMSLLRARREILSGARVLARLLPAAAATFTYQVCYVEALYLRDVLPGLAYMLLKASVLFTAVLSCTFFLDERSVVRDWRFIVGAALSVLGLAGFIAGGPTAVGSPAAGTSTLAAGIALVLVAAFFWSTYTVLVKVLVRRGSPLVTYTYVCTLMTIAFAVLTVVKGNTWVRVPSGPAGVWVWIVAAGSGVLCVGVAHAGYYYAIRALGTTVCATVVLANTFIPPLLSVFIFDERFNAWQVVGAVVLVVGGTFTIWARPTAAGRQVGR